MLWSTLRCIGVIYFNLLLARLLGLSGLTFTYLPTRGSGGIVLQPSLSLRGRFRGGKNSFLYIS